MKSGIYAFEFSDGSFYIGKSNNILTRWQQHEKALLKGTHAKKVQEVYDRLGMPKFKVIKKVHPDHIDLIEAHFINELWGNPKLLNTTRPPSFTDREKQVIEESFDNNVWEISTVEHLVAISDAQKELKQLKAKLERSKNGKILQEQQEIIENLKDRYNRLHDASWLERMFNWPPR